LLNDGGNEDAVSFAISTVTSQSFSQLSPMIAQAQCFDIVVSTSSAVAKAFATALWDKVSHLICYSRLTKLAVRGPQALDAHFTS